MMPTFINVRIFQRSGVGENDTVSVAIDMVTKSLVKSRKTISRGVITIFGGNLFVPRDGAGGM